MATKEYFPGIGKIKFEGKEMPASCVGFVNLMAFFGIAAASFMTAPIGARLSHSLPTAKLKKGFAVFLIIVALRMLLGLF